MKKFIPLLSKTQMFSGIGEKETEAMLSCLGAKIKSFKKGEYVLRQGQHLSDILVLAEGNLHIRKEDYWGNLSILGKVSPGEMFGESYVAPESGAILNDVVAIEDSVVMFFDVRRIITTCKNSCQFHYTVIQNLFFAISEKNRNLVQKLGYMSKRTTREKLLSYLSEEAKKQKSSEIQIPFNRQQLADFLSVDRSAMSNELSKMRREGILEYEKNQFILL